MRREGTHRAHIYYVFRQALASFSAGVSLSESQFLAGQKSTCRFWAAVTVDA